MHITIYGRPTTKKNSSRVVMRGRYPKVLPSKYYKDYERDAHIQLMQVKATFNGPVAVKCVYYMPDRRSSPDLVGLLQATSDILESAGVISNDKYIINYDGSCIAGVDKDNPRVEIDIRATESEFWKGR